MPNTDYTDYRIGYIISEILYSCIPRAVSTYLHTAYMPKPDYTDYRVRYIISKDNVNVIFPTALSTDMQLQYCIPVFPRLY